MIINYDFFDSSMLIVILFNLTINHGYFSYQLASFPAECYANGGTALTVPQAEPKA